MEFVWNDLKARMNAQKHGVSFDEAVTCFYDPHQVAFYDPDHSDDENREILIGHSNQGRLLLVVYTIRDENIRIFSARQVTKREGEDYEKRV